MDNTWTAGALGLSPASKTLMPIAVFRTDFHTIGFTSSLLSLMLADTPMSVPVMNASVIFGMMIQSKDSDLCRVIHPENAPWSGRS